jgi:hypothetical protein
MVTRELNSEYIPKHTHTRYYNLDNTTIKQNFTDGSTVIASGAGGRGAHLAPRARLPAEPPSAK